MNQPKGYPRFNGGPYVEQYVHRAVWKDLAANGPLRGVLPSDWHVHHQDNDRMNFAPWNLIAMPPVFNVRRDLRCPYTGAYLTPAEYKQRLGIRDDNEVPF